MHFSLVGAVAAFLFGLDILLLGATLPPPAGRLPDHHLYRLDRLRHWDRLVECVPLVSGG